MGNLDKAIGEAVKLLIENPTLTYDYLTNSAENVLKSKDLAKIVVDHSIGSALAAVASGWLPAAGGTIAVVISSGFIWSMYVRINLALKLKISKTALKSLASAVASNLITQILGSVVLITVLSFTGVGNIVASGIAGVVCYGVAYVAGIIYFNILVKLFKSKTNLENVSEENLKSMAETAIKEENIKEMFKESKKSYEEVKDNGKLNDENAAKEIIE